MPVRSQRPRWSIWRNAGQYHFVCMRVSTRSLACRSLADFVTFILSEVKTRPPDVEDEDIARINALREEVRFADLQQATLLEAAHVEAAQGGRSGRRIAVPFQAMV